MKGDKTSFYLLIYFGGIMKLITSILIVFGLFFLSCSDDDSGPTDSGGGTNISGTVLIMATQAPVSGAKVSLGDQLETTTDASGNYTLSNVPTVKQDFRVEKSGFAVYVEDFTPVQGANTYNVSLETHTEYCNRVGSVNYRNKDYNTVLIGGVCWFKENLNAGTKINWGGDWENEEQPENNTILEKYCANNQESNCDKWGGLYSWNEAMNWLSAHSNQGICPDGWRLPTIAEFESLVAIAGQNADALRAVGEGNGTNETGWTGLNATAHFMENAGAGPVIWGGPRWWSSSEAGDDYSQNFALWDANIIYETNLKYLAFSVRCVKD
jgi:uncharacterized protein (TIGR02145 family)